MSECKDDPMNVRGHEMCLKALTERKVPDRYVLNVGLTFRSKKGNSYMAGHVFKHPVNRYIILVSQDKDREDFIAVARLIAKAYGGTVDNNILNRGRNDTAGTIDVGRRWLFLRPFSQRLIRKQLDKFFRKQFDDVQLTAIDYDAMEAKFKGRVLSVADM